MPVHVPVRQWVLSLPFALRYRLAYDPGMVSAVLQVFVRTVFGFLRRKARDYGIDGTQCGAVTFIQRFGGSLNANVHFHMLALDGVYAPGSDGKAEFFALRAPETVEVVNLAGVLAHRIPALLKGKGLDPQEADAETSDPLVRDQPWLADIYAASICGRIATGPNAGQRVAIAGDRIDPEGMDAASSPRCASVSGFSLHANVAVPAGDRLRLERLCRYTARPPLATDRLEALPDGRLIYRFKTPWRNGTTHAVFEPLEFIEKLSALVPTPRAHLVRYSGILAPAAKWRAFIVPVSAPSETDRSSSELPELDSSSTVVAAPDIGEDLTLMVAVKPHPRNYPWAELMKRVFYADVLACDRCGGRLRIISTIHPPETTRKILECMGLPSRPPPIAPAAREETFFDPA